MCAPIARNLLPYVLRRKRTQLQGSVECTFVATRIRRRPLPVEQRMCSSQNLGAWPARTRVLCIIYSASLKLFSSSLISRSLAALSRPISGLPAVRVASYECRVRWRGECWSWAASCRLYSWPTEAAARSHLGIAGCSSPCKPRTRANTSCEQPRVAAAHANSRREAARSLVLLLAGIDLWAGVLSVGIQHWIGVLLVGIQLWIEGAL